MTNQIKIQHTEKHKTSQGVYDVCKGILILIEPTEEELDNLPKEGMPGTYVWLIDSYVDNIPCRKMYKPIIISKTEKIEDGDKVFCLDVHRNNAKPESCGIYIDPIRIRSKTCTCTACKKVLVSPEDFSIRQLQTIADGKLNNGAEVYVECEIHPEWLKENPAFDNNRAKEYYQIKRIKNKVKIFN